MRKKHKEMNESETATLEEEELRRQKSKLKQEKGAVVETGSLKKRHHFRS